MPETSRMTYMSEAEGVLCPQSQAFYVSDLGRSLPAASRMIYMSDVKEGKKENHKGHKVHKVHKGIRIIIEADSMIEAIGKKLLFYICFVPCGFLVVFFFFHRALRGQEHFDA